MFEIFLLADEVATFPFTEGRAALVEVGVMVAAAMILVGEKRRDPVGNGIFETVLLGIEEQTLSAILDCVSASILYSGQRL